MILCDVNVLIYAFREDAPNHAEYRAWIEERLASREAFAVSELVLSSVIRVVTHPRIFNPPTPLDRALEFAQALRSQPNVVLVAPAERHWEIFTGLCMSARAKGNLIADAYFAALAIEHGCEWYSADRDYSRFRGLRWKHPLDAS